MAKDGHRPGSSAGHQPSFAHPCATSASSLRKPRSSSSEPAFRNQPAFDSLCLLGRSSSEGWIMPNDRIPSNTAVQNVRPMGPRPGRYSRLRLWRTALFPRGERKSLKKKSPF